MNQEYLKTCYHEHVFRGVEARVRIYDVNPWYANKCWRMWYPFQQQ